MIPAAVNEALNNNCASYIRPFLWYSGENKELLAREIRAIAESGAKEFVFENRGGDWFGTDFWWDIFGFTLDYAKSLGLRVWSIDDSHVNTGSANDSLHKEENACYRAINLRLDMVDAAGPLTGGAFSLPSRKEKEEIIQISAFRRDLESGNSYGEALDLTDCVRDGLLVADIPDGTWRIYFVMTTNPERHGLFGKYITMMSKDSCRHLINEIHEKMYGHFADYFGNTFAGFFSDEPAFGNCDGQYGPNAYNLRLGMIDKMFPWWHDFPQRLAKLCNTTPEDVMLKLPALWDAVDEVSAALRLAYMDLVTALWQENFSEQLGKWCEEHNVEYIGHNLEDADAHMRTGWGCGHYFRSMKGQHMSGMDIVFEQLTPGISTVDHAMNTASRTRSSTFYHYTLPKLAASLAHITPHMKNRALSEIFGATGWTCGLTNMYSLFNHTLICGVNNYVPHAYAIPVPKVFESQQDRENAAGSVTPPGYCMTYLPPTFHAGGYNPQYKVFCDIIKYVQRVSHITSTSQHTPDIAVYYCAESDWMNCGSYRSMDDVSMKLIRSGYDFEFLPLDTILNDTTVAGSKIAVNNEQYKALILPGSEIIPDALLQKIADFAAAGVKVFFTDYLPLRTEKGDITGDICKNIQVLPWKTLGEALSTSIPRDFAVAPQQPDLRHYAFVDNCGNRGVMLLNSSLKAITFDLPGKNHLIYDPWINKAYRLDNNTLQLTAQKIVVVYNDMATSDLPVYAALPAAFTDLDLDYNIFARSATDKEFKLLRSNSKTVNLNIEEKLTRFCGEFRYESTFECSNGNATTLMIPQAGDAAELILNGVNCGVAFGPCCIFNVAGVIKSGTNTLEIKTFDSPAYADRTGDKNIGWGSGFPLRAHGFVGKIMLG